MKAMNVDSKSYYIFTEGRIYMIRFEIVTRDRLGITVEILEKIYNRKINLISMEVFFQKVCAKVDNRG